LPILALITTALVLGSQHALARDALDRATDASACHQRWPDGTEIATKLSSEDTCPQIEFFRQDCARLRHTYPLRIWFHCPGW
jgi:hypothetical protein